MTANQVAYANSIINQQLADETTRHNQAYEEETKRHNIVTEDLSKQQLEIDKEKQYWDAWYKQESAGIQKSYNQWYQAWTESSGKRKLEIEAYLADISRQKNDIQDRYQENLVRLQSDELDLKRRSQEEVEKVNLWNQENKTTELNLSAWRNFITDKQVEYTNSYNNASIQLGNLNAVYNYQKNQQSYELGLMGMEVERLKLMRDASALELNKALTKAQTFKYYLEGVGSLFSNATKVVSPFVFGKF